MEDGQSNTAPSQLRSDPRHAPLLLLNGLHGATLMAAGGHSEPRGQIAAREMEIVRIKGALDRVEELNDHVAAAIEQAL